MIEQVEGRAVPGPPCDQQPAATTVVSSPRCTFFIESRKEGKSCLLQWNRIMVDAFRELSKSYFYTVFPQLISRITHPSVAIFETMKVQTERGNDECSHAAGDAGGTRGRVSRSVLVAVDRRLPIGSRTAESAI
jgi:hypothetical protein